MVKKFLEQALKESDIKDRGNCWLEDNHKEILYRDLTLIDFNSLYPHIITQLYNEGLIPESEEKYIKKIKFLLENRLSIKKNDPDEYYELRKFTNAYWGNILRRYHPKNAQYVTDYLYNFYLDLIGDNPDNIVYADCDMIFINNVNDNIINKVKALDIPYNTSNIEYFYIMAKKRLCYTDENNFIKTKGLATTSGRYDDKKKFLESLIIEARRNDKLLELGI